MTLFLTSSPCIYKHSPATLNPANGFLKRIRSKLPPAPRTLFVASSPADHARTDFYCGDMAGAFERAGIPLTGWQLLDDLTAADAKKLIAWSDFIILMGGHVPTQNEFFNRIGDTVDFLVQEYGLSSVTTASPVIAGFLKKNFSCLELRASVNMEIGSVSGMEYLQDLFDGYYLKRELNRDLEAVARLSEWCDQNGKVLYALANSGCLNNCSAHNFHDNLVAHEMEISKMDNAYLFEGICHSFLKDDKIEYYPIPEFTLIDHLNKIGIESSFQNRKRIAKNNGMLDYRGTSDENLKLLDLLNNGKLIK